MAAAKPDWVKSLCLYEPAGLPSVARAPEHLVILHNERNGMAPVDDAGGRGELTTAVTLAVEWTEGIAGSFDRLPPEVKQAILENAHTLQLHFTAPPSRLTCDELSAIPAPVTVMWGADTRPYFATFANAIRQCLTTVEAVELPGSRHFAPFRDPDLFARQVLAHLERCGAVSP
jgi:pimeloyl-ACP methyl ester carboxylesterase